MERSREAGMQTFDQALFDLYQNGEIDQENALKFADSRNNLSLKIRMSEDHTLDTSDDIEIEQDKDDMGGMNSF